MANTEGIFPIHARDLLNGTFRSGAVAYPTPFPATNIKFCLDHPGITGASILAAAAAFTTRIPFAFAAASATLGTIANSALVTIPGASISVSELWKYWVAYTTIGPTGGTAYWSGTVNGTVGANIVAGLDADIAIGQLVASFSVAS